MSEPGTQAASEAPSRPYGPYGSQRPIRPFRTLLAGTLLMAAVILIVTWAELVTGKIMIGFLQLPPVVLPLLFLLIVLNKAVGRLAPRAALNAGEIALIFTMMVLASMIASRGIMED